jgi:hypothetical protein
MNAIETRIYEDASSAAADITAADIPPLRLSSESSQPRRDIGIVRPGGTGAGLPGGSRRWLAALAAAASVIAVIALVVAAGRSPDATRRGLHPAARPSPGLSHVQRALGAEALDQYFPATGAQYTAGLAFEWTRLRISARIFDSCMADAGFRQPAFAEKERAYLRSFPDNSQFPDLRQRARARSMSGPAYIATRPAVPGTSAGRTASRRCSAASARPFRHIDKIASPLERTWMNAVTAIQASPGVDALQSSFSACLETHGVPADYAHQTISGSLFGGFFAWADHLTQTTTSTSQQAASNRRWTHVFVQCARPTVTVTERLQTARRARFFRLHARQIAAIKTLAAALP